MRVTIEIEPEEAARFVKAFVPSVPVINNVTDVKWPIEFSESVRQQWLDMFNAIGGIQK